MAVVRVLLAMLLSTVLAEEACEETALLQGQVKGAQAEGDQGAQGAEQKEIKEHKSNTSTPATCVATDTQCCMAYKCSILGTTKPCPGTLNVLYYDCVGSSIFDTTGTGYCRCKTGNCGSDGKCGSASSAEAAASNVAAEAGNALSNAATQAQDAVSGWFR
mmetsp:Transcript_51874/g.93090  ORF Transcript_51874/g.93090 Transcript_51874/m.93090 type:complete len:161 (+) Transcript_51874:65-547(+)|eukprot:CAMPEP_0197655144 /NCGR_PEP_ID=MMETSP1338-20131121/39278_1 /TAXON_ID=43686 ORGANISM="Pelagodinium beii, Strain RCC1491" /NCGR_SAMPLE_ID=MMETSP1338 /ASSEMBLY_ACC=CAM_ASM_000754 /LENGTH=160 /DNA_ID=CAMNT_0043230733 /DNA_START=61 /DNA_END=543 /DNA_ORIENTATION=+